MRNEYIFEEKEYKKVHNLAKELFNISNIVNYYMLQFKYFDEVDNILPILEYMRKKSDDLYYSLMSNEKEQ